MSKLKTPQKSSGGNQWDSPFKSKQGMIIA